MISRRGMRGVFAVLVTLGLSGVLCPAAVAAPGPPDAPQYYFDQWNIPGLWATGIRGQGVIIAEIDTGVNAALPELAGKIMPGTDFGVAGGNGQVDRDTDQFGHGTAMASIMVASPGTFGISGIAPAASILPIALPLVGTADASTNDRLPDAITYAADHGAAIISMSLGETRRPANDSVPCPQQLQDAVFYAMSKGAILVAASGNQGQTGSPVVDPGVCLGVVAVGAVDSAGLVAGFSSRHPYLALSAPGVDIASLSRVPGRAYSGQGTSQATALTAAALALVKSAHPDLSARAVVARMLQTAQPGPGVPAGRRDPGYGYGRIDVNRAVRAQISADAPNPVYDAALPFLARYQASLRATAAPPPPKLQPAPLGPAVTSSPPPPQIPRQAWLAAAVATAGLVLLLTTLFWCRPGRRERGRRRRPSHAPPGSAAGEPVDRADDRSKRCTHDRFADADAP